VVSVCMHDFEPNRLFHLSYIVVVAPSAAAGDGTRWQPQAPRLDVYPLHRRRRIFFGPRQRVGLRVAAGTYDSAVPRACSSRYRARDFCAVPGAWLSLAPKLQCHSVGRVLSCYIAAVELHQITSSGGQVTFYHSVIRISKTCVLWYCFQGC
jgi:hypothetical protein